MKVKIDKDKCIGCGSCVAICPECFEIADDNKARVIDDENEECIKEAIDVCPVQVIEIEK